MNQKRGRLISEFRDDVTDCNPVNGRVYTMTHSDETANLYVTVGCNIAKDQVDLKNRDEVIAYLSTDDESSILWGCVLISGEGIPCENAKKRNEIFLREMHVALRAIRVADDAFYSKHPECNNAKVFIQFRSDDEQYHRWYDFGKIAYYSKLDR